MTVEQVGNLHSVDLAIFSGKTYCGILAQYPDTYGHITDWTGIIEVGSNTERELSVVGTIKIIESTSRQ